MADDQSKKSSLNEADLKKDISEAVADELKEVKDALDETKDDFKEEIKTVGVTRGKDGKLLYNTTGLSQEEADQQINMYEMGRQHAHEDRRSSRFGNFKQGLGNFFRKVGKSATHSGGDGSPLMFWVVIIAITLLGPFVANVYSIDNGVAGFTGLFILAGVIILIERTGIIGDHRFVSLIYLVCLNLFLPKIFLLDSILIRFIGGGDPIFITFTMAILSILVFFKLAFALGTKVIFVVSLLLVFIFFGSYIQGYAQSGRLADDIASGSTGTQSELSNTNIVERLRNRISFFGDKGRGDTNPTVEQELGYKYFGVSMERPEVITNTFTNAPIIRVDYNTDSESQFITVQTTCTIEDVVAKADPQLLQITSFISQPVRCEFPELAEGSYIAKVTGLYSFSSTLKQSVLYVTQQEINSIINSGEEVEDALGTILKPEVNNGPLDFGVSNTKVDGRKTFQQPIIIDLDREERPPHTIEFELKNPAVDKSRSGTIKLVNSAIVSVPAGIVIERCGAIESPSYVLDEDGLLSYDVTEHFQGIETSLIMQCDFSMADPTEFFSVARQSSQDNIYVSVDYTYVIEQTVPVIIE